MKNDIKSTNENSLINGLEKYAEKDKAIFSMPGHKGRYEPLKKILNLKFDVTETEDTDSLFLTNNNSNQDGIIANTEKKAAGIYNTYKTFLSSCGSTACIQTIIALIAKENEKIICARNCHISVINCCALLGVEIVWVYPKDKDNSNFSIYSGYIDKNDIEEALINNPDSKGVFITSPDYFGLISDLKSISEVCKKYNVIFAVDNAHGAHLNLFKRNLHPLECGVDICCDSAHKTLPALTSAAFLHINNPLLAVEAKEKMSLFATSSPSYLILASLDVACDYLKKKGKEDFLNLEKIIIEVKEKCLDFGYNLIKDNCDPTRLVVNFNFKDDKTVEFKNVLKENNVEAEFCENNTAIFIPSPFNNERDFARLIFALEKFAKEYSLKKNKCFDEKMQGEFFKCEKVLSLRKAVFSKYEIKDIDECENFIAAQSVFLCPPGISPVIPGEKITKNIIKILKTYGVFRLKVLKCK